MMNFSACTKTENFNVNKTAPHHIRWFYQFVCFNTLTFRSYSQSYSVSCSLLFSRKELVYNIVKTAAYRRQAHALIVFLFCCNVNILSHYSALYLLLVYTFLLFASSILWRQITSHNVQHIYQPIKSFLQFLHLTWIFSTTFLLPSYREIGRTQLINF